jgi:CheY-like chemotaxis protein
MSEYQRMNLDIVLVDDDRSDQDLFMMAMQEVAANYKISFARNGEELFELLARFSAINKLPSVIFMDLNMPVKDGRETLSQLKASDQYKKIPVFIYTTSSSKEDVAQCYDKGANLYLNKPYDYETLIKGLRSICQLIPDFLILPH